MQNSQGLDHKWDKSFKLQKHFVQPQDLNEIHSNPSQIQSNSWKKRKKKTTVRTAHFHMITKKHPFSVPKILYIRRQSNKIKTIYSGTSLKQTRKGQNFLCALERCPPWRGLNWKVTKFKVQLFYTGPTLTRTPPTPYLTIRMWNGEKKVIFFVMYQFILHQRLK